MKRLILLTAACGITVSSLALGQRHPMHMAQHHAAMHHQAMMYQAAMMYHASVAHQQAVLHQQQAAMVQAWRRQAVWHAQARKGASVVVRRPQSGTAKKNAVTQPLVVSTTASSVRQTKPATGVNAMQTTVSIQSRTLAAGPSKTSFLMSFRETEKVGSRAGKYVFKDTLNESWRGSGGISLKERFSQTEQITTSAGKEVIKDQWSAKAVTSQALAYLPPQVQLAALESLLPYQPSFWPTYYGGNPQKASLQAKVAWPGGVQTTTATLVDRYDKAGRFLGAQMQVKDSASGQPAATAGLTPQAQLNYLETASLAGGTYPYAIVNPLAPSWGYPYFSYRYGWTALNRLAVLDGMPIW